MQSVRRPTLGISNGQVVGTSETTEGEHAFLWTETGGMQDLNSLLTLRSGFILTQAVSINSQGIILAVGQNDDTSQTHEKPLRIFMLVPTP
jgi:probable HAF family extracellular repeat protein